MKRLISIELQKIWKNRASRVLTLAYFILLALIAFLASYKFEIGNFRLHLAEMGIFNFPYIWHFNTYIADFFKFFLAVIIVSMMANEYSYGTLKQNLIDGMSKEEFILSKFLTVVVFAGASTVFVFVMSLILGYFFSAYTETDVVLMQMDYLFAYFIKLIGFFSICLFLGILIRRSAFALGFLIAWYIGEMMTYGTLNRPDYGPHFADKVSAYFPLISNMNLIVEPFSRLSTVQNMQSAIGVTEVKDYSVHFSAILIVLVYTVIFMLSSYLLLKKRDL